MNRKVFLAKSIIVGIGSAILPSWINVSKDNTLFMRQVKPQIKNFGIEEGIYLKEDQTNKARFEVTLNKPEKVDIMIKSRNGFIQFDKAQLTFTPQNYNIPQTVTVTGRELDPKGVKYDDIMVEAELNKNITSKSVRTVDRSISPDIYDIEPLSKTHWDTSDDLNTLRENTIDWVWGSGYGKGDGQIPFSKQPSKVQDHKNDKYIDTSGITGIAEQKKLTVDLGNKPGCYLYLFIPKEPNGDFIYHPTGHSANWAGLVDCSYDQTIQKFINQGNYVITNYMITGGPNPELQTQFGQNYASSHNQMGKLENMDPYFNPLQYFLEPAIVGINYMVANYSPKGIYMTGLSGGGWTTIWIAALDRRIQKSFNVSGNYPEWIRDVYGRTYDDDYEQGHDDPRIPGRNTTQFIIDQYERVGMLDLYCMAAQERVHYQWNNIYDSCCFFGYYNTVYKEELKKKLKHGEIGTFDAFLFNVPGQHTYNEQVIDHIIESIKNG